MNGIDLPFGRDNHIGGPVIISSPQFYDCLEPRDSDNAVRLPNIDKRKPLVDDAKDFNADSDLNQQQQQQQRQHHQLSFNSTSFSSYSFDDTLTEVDLVESQQIRHVKKPFEPSTSAYKRVHRGNQGFRAARQRFLLNKAAKQREAKAVAEALNREFQASETSYKLSKTLNGHSGAMDSFGNMSSTSEISAQQMAVSWPAVPPQARSLHTKNPTPSTTGIDGGYSQSSPQGRSHNAFQLQLLSGHIYQSSATMAHNHRAQDDGATGEYLLIKVRDLPDHTTTRDLWGAFNYEGHIAHIRLHETAKGYRDGGASIKFRSVSEPC